LHGDLHLQFLRRFVEGSRDAEGPVVDDAPRQLRDPRQSSIEVEDGATSADLRQRLERSRVLRAAARTAAR
jgi:hypothetical protein